jgi:hypothetical protein
MVQVQRITQWIRCIQVLDAQVRKEKALFTTWTNFKKIGRYIKELELSP